MDDEDYLTGGGGMKWMRHFLTGMAGNWYFLLAAAILALAAIPAIRHNRNAARNGENPIVMRVSFGRNPFRKSPEEPYADDRRINRDWKS